jgi:hypothetical protein
MPVVWEDARNCIARAAGNVWIAGEQLLAGADFQPLHIHSMHRPLPG